MDLWVAVRLVHIFAAIFWVGTSLFVAFFLEPAIEAAGAAGGKVMETLIVATPFSPVIAASGFVTVLAGLLLYGRSPGLSPSAILVSRPLLSLGALAGFLAVAVGSTFQGRAAGGMKELAREIAAQGGPPTEAQQAQIAAHQRRIRRGSRITAALMIVAVLGMVLG